MPNRMKIITETGRAYGIGRRTYRLAFQTTLGRDVQRTIPGSLDVWHPPIIQRREVEEIPPETQQILDACEALWVRDRVKQVLKPLVKELRPQIREAAENNRAQTLKALRKRLATARKAERERLWENDGVVGGMNNALTSRDYRKARDYFVICAGTLELDRRKQEKIFARFRSWLEGRAMTKETIGAYLDAQGLTGDKREEEEEVLLGFLKALEQAEEGMGA